MTCVYDMAFQCGSTMNGHIYSLSHNYSENIFSGYFKYYCTYDHFFSNVRSPCQKAWPVPKSP